MTAQGERETARQTPIHKHNIARKAEKTTENEKKGEKKEIPACVFSKI